MKLSYCDQSNRVQSMMKTRQDNEVIDYKGIVYVKNEVKLSWLIELSAVYDENQTRQWCDQSYRCDLLQKRYWTVMFDQT